MESLIPAPVTPRPTLFRQEAVEARRVSLVGEALQANPISYPLLASSSIVLIVALVLFGSLGHFTRKAHVQGYLAPSAGLIKVYSTEIGTVIEKHVSEGQRVSQGDALFMVSTERASTQTSQAQATAIAQIEQRLANLQAEHGNQERLTRVQSQAIRQSLLSQERELQELDVALTIQQERAADAERTAERHAKLLADRFITQTTADEKRAELLEQQSRLQDLRRTRTQLQRQIMAERQDLIASELSARQRLSEAERQFIELDQQRTEYQSRRTLVITAPADGTVTAITAEPGQMANTRAPLLAILPKDAQLQAKLLVPSSAIGLIGVGDSVRLRYQAFPYQRFGSHEGTVTEIARTLMTAADLDVPIEVSQPVYRVTVALRLQQIQAANMAIPLQAGMQLDADVMLERRRLVEWLIEPLLTVAKRV